MKRDIVTIWAVEDDPREVAYEMARWAGEVGCYVEEANAALRRAGCEEVREAYVAALEAVAASSEALGRIARRQATLAKATVVERAVPVARRLSAADRTLNLFGGGDK